MEMHNISDEELQDLICDKLTKMGVKCPPTNLYCLNCGVLINDHYDGHMMSYTHFCSRENQCTSLTTERCWLFSAGMIAKNIGHKQCKHCETKEEHIEKTIQYYLGKNYKDFTPKIKRIADLKEGYIKTIRQKIIDDDNGKYDGQYNRTFGED